MLLLHCLCEDRPFLLLGDHIRLRVLRGHNLLLIATILRLLLLILRYLAVLDLTRVHSVSRSYELLRCVIGHCRLLGHGKTHAGLRLLEDSWSHGESGVWIHPKCHAVLLGIPIHLVAASVHLRHSCIGHTITELWLDHHHGHLDHHPRLRHLLHVLHLHVLLHSVAPESICHTRVLHVAHLGLEGKLVLF